MPPPPPAAHAPAVAPCFSRPLCFFFGTLMVWPFRQSVTFFDFFFFPPARLEFRTGRPRRSGPRRSRAALAAGRGDHADGGLTGQPMHPCCTPDSPRCHLYFGRIVSNRAAECTRFPPQLLLPLRGDQTAPLLVLCAFVT